MQISKCIIRNHLKVRANRVQIVQKQKIPISISLVSALKTRTETQRALRVSLHIIKNRDRGKEIAKNFLELSDRRVILISMLAI